LYPHGVIIKNIKNIFLKFQIWHGTTGATSASHQIDYFFNIFIFFSKFFFQIFLFFYYSIFLYLHCRGAKNEVLIALLRAEIFCNGQMQSKFLTNSLKLLENSLEVICPPKDQDHFSSKTLKTNISVAFTQEKK